jgi:hypothetical protein
VERIACIIDSCVPTHSSTESAPMPFGHVHDALHALVAALGHDVGRAELAGELLPLLVAAHRDDPLGAHLLRRQHAEQADRAVADDDDRRSRLHVRGVGGEPAGAQHVRRRQQARDQIGRRGRPGVGTSVPSASGTRSTGACARVMNSRCTHDDW